MDENFYGMTEAEFRKRQEKHRREAEAIRAGIKARKLRLQKIMRCGEAVLQEAKELELCSVEDTIAVVRFALQQEAVKAYLQKLSETGEGR